jgi:hypothetical protein
MLFMQPYNAAFFKTHEVYFLTIRDTSDETTALDAMRAVMERNLGAAYDTMGVKRGNPQDFVRVVGERDASVGLHVEFPVVNEKKIVYQFYTDPFPGLNGEVDPQKLASTYMDFKVSYLLGANWAWRMTKHAWRGNEYTEYVIEKK